MASQKFFAPTPELTEKLLLVQSAAERRMPLSGREPFVKLRRLLRREFDQLERSLNRGEQGNVPLIERARADVSNRLYHYLAALGRESDARSGNAYHLDEVLPEGMRQRLGIPFKHRELLKELSVEFRDWMMENKGERETGWGLLRLGDDDRLEIDVRTEGFKLEPVGRRASVVYPEQEWRTAAAPERERLMRHSDIDAAMWENLAKPVFGTLRSNAAKVERFHAVADEAE